jgi:hypothetical protein
MTDVEQRSAAKQFAADWKDRGDEKQETQTFWLTLLQKVYGVTEPDKFIQFEVPVKLSHTSFIDGYISDTHVLIEQKGAKIDLNKGETQSDGSVLTPFQQARRYAGYLPHDQNPRWIVVCNFREFRIHDMNRPNDTPEVLLLSDLEKEYSRLDFLVDTGDEHIKKEMDISLKAGDLVGVLYDALLKQYAHPDSPETLKSLNALCVRIVFCLYAEDAGIFGKRDMFHDYLQNHRAEDRRALINLFRVLDQKPEERDPYLDNDLAAFPYVNGGLFANEDIEIPRLGDEIIDLLLERASEDFDWSAISPTIFGAVFESTLNPETRRSGGMHYTSIENIHKVIDPLFLDELNAEFAEIKEIAVAKTRNAKLNAFQRKLAGLKFLDPACGSGNFLTETYLSLRRLENKVISMLHEGQIVMEMTNPIQVSIDQFYGIEINDFAVTVAKTALWIAESQMMKETEDVVHMSLDFLPLKTNAHIVEGNALRLDWESVVPKGSLSYIMGNPPFVGKKERSSQQTDDLISVVGKEINGVGNLDYVTGWYVKAATYMQSTEICAAFVSTNSITQGEQPPILWSKLSTLHTKIIFAHRTFKWNSEAKEKAAVHCVILGFSVGNQMHILRLYDGVREQVGVNNINPYLLDAPNTLVRSRNHPICNVPDIVTGNQATDDGNFFISSEEYDDFVAKTPIAKKYLKKAYNSQGFINGKYQYCLWLEGVSPSELRQMPEVLERVENVRQYRMSSPKEATRKQADTPTLFTEIRQPKSHYIVIPKVSSENRRYIPLGFLDADVICNNTIKFVPDADLYHFGVLCSNVHNAWMRAVAGRMKSDYQYSNTIVYNNFPWPTPTDEQRAKIEQTAQAILDARALYPDSSLADLYDEVTMPPELRKAHQQNDKAVMQAYGFWGKYNSETACVAELMKLYQKLTQ